MPRKREEEDVKQKDDEAAEASGAAAQKSRTVSDRTFMAKPQEVKREWLVLDAAGVSLGRLAVEAAKILRGKHKPIFTPHVDTGDFVIVTNAEKLILTGNKKEDKFFVRHSGYPGGLKSTPYGKLLSEKPEFVVREAVRGMLPHNRLGRKIIKKLKVYRGSDHPHQSQKPQKIDLGRRLRVG